MGQQQTLWELQKRILHDYGGVMDEPSRAWNEQRLAELEEAARKEMQEEMIQAVLAAVNAQDEEIAEAFAAKMQKALKEITT